MKRTIKLLSLLLLAASAFGQVTFADRAYSTLASPMAATATTLTLVDASRFPDAEYWVIICPLGQCGVGATAANGETVYVTGKSGNVLTIGSTGRDVQGDGSGTSTGSGGNPTHSAGEAVVLAPPAAWFNSIESSSGSGAVVGHGPYSSLPGSGADGEVYFFDGTDTIYTKAIHNGSSWDLYYNGYKCTPFVLGDYSWDNQGTLPNPVATATASGGFVTMTVAVQGSNVRALYKTAPSTPYTITALFVKPYPGNEGNPNAGPFWRQSSDGKLVTVEAGEPAGSEVDQQHQL